MCCADGVHLHYIDCDVRALQAASLDPNLENWKLYCAQWYVLAGQLYPEAIFLAIVPTGWLFVPEQR